MECGICTRVREIEKSSKSSFFILAASLSEDERECCLTFVAKCCRKIRSRDVNREKDFHEKSSFFFSVV